MDTASYLSKIEEKLIYRHELYLLCLTDGGVLGYLRDLHAHGFHQHEGPENGRIMAFLWVGLAYFITAVVAPLVILKLKGGNIAFWNYPPSGWKWSLIAGTLGAIGALGVLLAFGSALLKNQHRQVGSSP